MEKIYGTKQRQDGLLHIGRSKWVLFYGFGKDDETNETGWEYRHTFDHKPTLSEVRELIISTIDKSTQEKIVAGFIWNHISVYLSTENQFNFKAAYDMAELSQGESLPVKFKLGEDEAGHPIYYEFTTLNDIRDFYTKAMKHINNTLNEGWVEKDGVNWNAFII